MPGQNEQGIQRGVVIQVPRLVDALKNAEQGVKDQVTIVRALAPGAPYNGISGRVRFWWRTGGLPRHLQEAVRKQGPPQEPMGDVPSRRDVKVAIKKARESAERNWNYQRVIADGSPYGDNIFGDIRAGLRERLAERRYGEQSGRRG